MTRTPERCPCIAAPSHPSRDTKDPPMNLIRVIAILGVAIGFSATTLTAAEGDKPKRPNLEELDKDKDGALSKEELEAGPERFRTRLLEIGRASCRERV